MRALMLAGAITVGLATSPAHADTTTTFSRVKTVNADAESVVGCVTTDIFLSSFDSNNDAGKGSQIYLEIFKQNSCTDKTLDHIVGFVVLRPSAFTENSNATSAKLVATVPIQTMKEKSTMPEYRSPGRPTGHRRSPSTGSGRSARMELSSR